MMLMPKLDEFESQNSDPTNDRYDEGLIYLVDMWKKQKEGNNVSWRSTTAFSRWLCMRRVD
jgi:hypothetical protein